MTSNNQIVSQTNVFKIQLADGTFSSGGTHPRSAKTGKTWTKKGHLSSHFTGLSAEGRRLYKGARVLTFTSIISIDKEEPVEQHIQAAKDRRAS